VPANTPFREVASSLLSVVHQEVIMLRILGIASVTIAALSATGCVVHPRTREPRYEERREEHREERREDRREHHEHEENQEHH
jgi:hypothetical protein